MPPIHAIIAVRGGSGAKRRCAGLLSDRDRVRLTELMLCDLLDSLGAARTVGKISVVTMSADMIGIVESAGAVAILQHPPLGLNEAFAQGARAARYESPDWPLAFLPADLPLLTAGEFDRAARMLDDHEVVAAPSRAGGTGALLVRPGLDFPLSFGSDSCARHVAAAAGLGLAIGLFESPGFLRDIDRPEDVLELAAEGGDARSAMFLRAHLRSGEGIGKLDGCAGDPDAVGSIAH